MRDVLAGEPTLAEALTEPAADPLLAPLVTPPLTAAQAVGLDLILEGFLLHHGRPRHLGPADIGAAVLAGDYCYAQGLIRVADAGDLFHIRALADLIALGSGLVAADRRDLLAPLWRGVTAAMASRGTGDEDAAADRHARACTAVRTGDFAAARELLDALGAGLPDTPELTEALA